MELGINGKTALVLGAGGGLGGAIARTLSAEGCQVAVADINKEAADKTVADITSAGGCAVAVVWDLGNLSLIRPNLEQIEAAFGTVDILVKERLINAFGCAEMVAGSPLWAAHQVF